MAHEIEIRDGQARMMYVAEEGRPWHKLGTPLGHVATAKEVWEICFPWTVRKEEVYFRTQDGFHVIPNHYAMVRNDTSESLGIVKGRYIPIQNHEAFKIGDMLAGEGAAIYHTAGSLQGGRRI